MHQSFSKKVKIPKYKNCHFHILIFRTLLRLLLENLADDIGATRALVFGVLTEMLKQEQLISCFQGYTELIILKVLESHRDTEKDVSILT